METTESTNGKTLIQEGKEALRKLWNWIKHTWTIKDELDKPGLKTELEKTFVFEGARVWILSFAIIMASVGLTAGSIPVIIGAMLIAPLGSPILGVGMSLGTNDWATLKRALTGLGQAVAVSLIVATVYFILVPIKTPSQEIVVRTVPTLLDIIIALVGGGAWVVSLSLKDKNFILTSVTGAAVGTALMPPLCTAAFGIATFNMGYFAGAFYLFLLNAIFIALPAYLFVRLMKFKKVTIEDAETERKHRIRLAGALAIIVIPSIWLFVGVVKESIFRSDVDDYITSVVDYNGTAVIEYEANYGNNTVEVFMIGNTVPDEVQNGWKSRLHEFDLDDTKLIINQYTNESTAVGYEIVEELYKEDEKIIAEQKEEIKDLKTQVKQLEGTKLPLLEVEQEIKALFPTINTFAFSQSMEFDFTQSVDTIPTFIVHWESDPQPTTLGNWLKLRLGLDKVKVIDHE